MNRYQEAIEIEWRTRMNMLMRSERQTLEFELFKYSDETD